MPDFNENDKVDAWNNLAAMIKFLSLEEYMKNATVKDFISSLNILSPQEQIPEKQTQDENIENNGYKEPVGFVTQKEQVISAIVKDLIQVVIDAFGKIEFTNDDLLLNKFKKVLRDHIEHTNDK